jgi:hypothetical protein
VYRPLRGGALITARDRIKKRLAFFASRFHFLRIYNSDPHRHAPTEAFI